MEKRELAQLCLNERLARQKQLNDELAKANVALAKAEFEENMYAHLREHSNSKCMSDFAKIYEDVKKKVDKIDTENTSKIESIKQSLRLIEEEIKYLQECIK